MTQIIFITPIFYTELYHLKASAHSFKPLLHGF